MIPILFLAACGFSFTGWIVIMIIGYDKRVITPVNIIISAVMALLVSILILALLAPDQFNVCRWGVQ